MSRPSKHLTAFDFYCNSFEELPAVMEEYVGYKVLPRDIWSIDISQWELSRLHVTLTIIYWKEEPVLNTQQAYQINRSG